MDDNKEELLTRRPETTNQLSKIITNARLNIKTKPPCLNFQTASAFTVLVVISTISAVLYSEANIPAGQRWDKFIATQNTPYNSTNQTLQYPFMETVYPLGGSTTNGMFNLETYLKLFYIATGQHIIRTNWQECIGAVFIAAGMLLPIWYLTPDKTWDIGVSTASNIPVQMYGGILFFITMRPYFKCKNTTSKKGKEQQRLVDKIKEKEAAISTIEDNKIVTLYETLDTNSNLDEITKIKKMLASLSIPEDETVNANLVKAHYLNQIIALPNTIQNIGYAYLAYQQGHDLLNQSTVFIKISMGVTMLLCSLVPNIGYTINGNQSNKQKIVNMLDGDRPLIFKEKSTCLMIYAIFSITLVTFFGLTSGGTADQANFISTCAFQRLFTNIPECSSSQLAWTMGIVSSFGTAVGYNSPLCWDLWDRINEVVLSRYGSENTQSRLGIKHLIEKVASFIENLDNDEFTKEPSLKDLITEPTN
jgi:hypothetical protein